MADVAADLTNDISRFEQVLFQRNKIVVDGELNEIGRLSRVRNYRLWNLNNAMVGETLNKRGRATCTGIEIVPGGVPGEITIQPITGKIGIICLRGYVFRLTAGVTLAGIDVNPAINQYYQIYIMITETEISSVDDATIKIPKLEETTRRVKTNVTFKLGVVNTDSASADNTSTEPYEGITSKKSGVIATIKRAAGGNGAVLVNQIFYNYIPTGDIQAFRTSNIYFTKQSMSGKSSVKWDQTTGTLTMDNVAITMPGLWREEGLEPIKIVMPPSCLFPNVGDALVIYLPSHRKYNGNTANLFAQIGVVDTPGTLEARVENIGIYKENYINDATRDDGFNGRFVFAVRSSTDTVLLRNGKSITFLPISANGLTTENSVIISEGSTVTEFYDKDLGQNNTDDSIPHVHIRYRPNSKYALLSQFREKIAAVAPFNPIYTRIYISGDPQSASFAITSNAKWVASTATWTVDSSVDCAYIFRLSRFDLLGVDEPRISYSQRAEGAPVTWTDTTWDLDGTGVYNNFQHFSINPNGAIGGPNSVFSVIEGFRKLQLSGTSDPVPAAYFSVKNTLGAVNIPKYYATFSVAAGVTALLDGLGITSLTVVGGNIRVQLNLAFTSTNYCVTITSRSSVFQTGYTVINASTFDIIATTSLGVAINFAAGAYVMAFVVHGRQ